MDSGMYREIELEKLAALKAWAKKRRKALDDSRRAYSDRGMLWMARIEYAKAMELKYAVEKVSRLMR